MNRTPVKENQIYSFADFKNLMQIGRGAAHQLILKGLIKPIRPGGSGGGDHRGKYLFLGSDILDLVRKLQD